jgi:4-hydroxy-2-oxoheptanedioate aldolase
MIEKGEAVKNLDDIFSVGGIDMVVFGGNDYSMSIGKPGGARDPEVRKVMQHVFETAMSMGIQPRAEISSPEQAKPFLDMGVRHFAIGTDLFILYRWIQENGAMMREMLDKA